MSEDKPRRKRKDGPRKVYKKIYRNKGEKKNGEPIKQLDDIDRGNQLYNLRYGRLCMAYAMEGLPKPPKPPHDFRGAHNDEKGKYYKFMEPGNGVLNKWRRLRTRPPKPKKTKTTNYFYY